MAYGVPSVAGEMLLWSSLHRRWFASASTMTALHIKKKKTEKAAGKKGWKKKEERKEGVWTIGLIAISPSTLSLDVT